MNYGTFGCIFYQEHIYESSYIIWWSFASASSSFYVASWSSRMMHYLHLRRRGPKSSTFAVMRPRRQRSRETTTSWEWLVITMILNNDATDCHKCHHHYYHQSGKNNENLIARLVPSDNCATGHSVYQPRRGQYCCDVVWEPGQRCGFNHYHAWRLTGWWWLFL